MPQFMHIRPSLFWPKFPSPNLTDFPIIPKSHWFLCYPQISLISLLPSSQDHLDLQLLAELLTEEKPKDHRVKALSFFLSYPSDLVTAL